MNFFNFGIINVVGKPLIDKGCLIFLSSLRKIVREEDSNLALEISVFMIVLL